MTIQINEGTPFAADIAATVGDQRYRLIVEGDGAAALYLEAADKFGQPFWTPAGWGYYQDVVAKIIVQLSRRGLDGPVSTETRPTEDQELMEG